MIFKMELIIISFVITILIILASIGFYYCKTKKKDEEESSETKGNMPQNKQFNVIPKKSRKKPGKKGNQNESEATNSMDDVGVENVENDTVHIEKSETYHATTESIIPLKSADEATNPVTKKKKTKAKHGSGDQLSTDNKTSDFDRNENQSNTLLGRSSEDKLKEDIQSLEKKLDDVEKEKAKNEASLREIQTMIHTKEAENENLKGNLANVTGQLKKCQIDINLEKEKSDKMLDNMKSQTSCDNAGHTLTYRKYENTIEQLKVDIKNQKDESLTLNKTLKEEMEKKENIAKQHNEVKKNLSEKIEELKRKEGDCHQFKETNTRLAKSVEELRQSLHIKENELVATRNNMMVENTNLKNVIETHKKIFDEKANEMEILKRNEIIQQNEVNKLSNLVRELRNNIDDKEKEFSNKIKELDESNTRLETELHKYNNDMLSNNRIIDELKTTNALLCEQISVFNDVEESTKAYYKSKDLIIEEKTSLIEDLKVNDAKAREDMCLLKKNIEDLHSVVAHKEKEIDESHSKLSSTVCQLQERISTLDNELKDKVCEIKESKTLLNQLEEELKKKCEDLSGMAENNSQLNAIICNLKMEIDEKSVKIDDLEKNTHSVRCEVEELKRSANIVMEESNSRDIVNSREELHLETLMSELHNQKMEIENLVQQKITLLNDKQLLEKASFDKTEELNLRIMELTDENSKLQDGNLNDEIIAERMVPLKTECQNYSSEDSDKVEELKSHITKLEKELIGMQGRYYVLKEDSVKIDDSEKHLNQTCDVSIPPNELENNCPIQPQHDSDTKSSAHDSLQEAINRLNSEIEEQRLTNQRLCGDLRSKQSEVNVLRQCLLGLDGSLNNIGDMANELQKSCLLTQSEKGTMKCQHEALIKDHELLMNRYIDLERQWKGLNESVHHDSNDNDMEDKIITLREENHNLKVLLEQYRDSLEKTEKMLEKIQCSVDKEETNWRTALRSSEEDCSLLAAKVQELSKEIEVIKTKNSSESNDVVQLNPTAIN